MISCCFIDSGSAPPAIHAKVEHYAQMHYLLDCICEVTNSELGRDLVLYGCHFIKQGEMECRILLYEEHYGSAYWRGGGKESMNLKAELSDIIHYMQQQHKLELELE